MRALRSLFIGSSLLGAAATSQAVIAFSNFGSGFTFGAGQWSIGKLAAFENAQIAQGFQFTASQSGDVSAIYVAVQSVVGENSSGAIPTFELHADSTNTVGTLLGTWTGSLVGAPAVQTLTGGTATLTAGTKYWLVARETSGTFAYGWTVNNQGAFGPRSSSGNDGASWAYFSNNIHGAFRIDVTPQSVPEPFTMALMGGAALAGFRRLRKRHVPA